MPNILNVSNYAIYRPDTKLINCELRRTTMHAEVMRYYPFVPITLELKRLIKVEEFSMLTEKLLFTDVGCAPGQGSRDTQSTLCRS